MQLIVKGDFTPYYNAITDSLDGDCPIQYSNAKLIFIDEDEVVFEVYPQLSRIERVNGVGDVEEVIFPK